MDNKVLSNDADYFLELQTRTGWGKTLYSFAEWCSPEPGILTLDVGCGPGLLSAIFSQLGCKAVGVDLDLEMFQPSPIYPYVAIADVYTMPFSSLLFDLISASNLLFLLSEPIVALIELKRLLRPNGRLAMLNPSENITETAATTFAEERGLEGLARDSLINWARRAEENHHWSDNETQVLYERAGMKYISSTLKIGPGFARFSLGTA